MTEPLFRQDAYLREVEAIVASAEPRDDAIAGGGQSSALRRDMQDRSLVGVVDGVDD